MFEDRWSVVSWPAEYGGRDVGIFEWLVFEEEYYRVRCTHPGEPERHLPARADHARVRDRGPEGALPPVDGVRRRDLVPGLVRARRRQRPGRHPLAGGAQRGGRRLDPERPEDLGQPRRLRRVVLRHLPHRPRRGAPPRAHLLPRRHGHAGRHRAADPPDRRRDGLRRDLLRQRRGARGPGAGRGRRRLVRRHGHGGLRTRPLAAQPGALHRGSRPPPPALRSNAAARPPPPTPWRRPTCTPRPTSCTPTGRCRASPAATRSAPRPVATRSSGPRPTSLSTPPRSTCSDPRPSCSRPARPGDWLDGYLFSLAGPIYAGTNEIQRNVVAERLLGLPRG